MDEIFIKVAGAVQGVGFRFETSQKANEFRLRGFVRNVSDRSVEILAQGQKQDLEKLLNWVKSGKPAGRIESIEFVWRKPAKIFEEFRIQY